MVRSEPKVQINVIFLNDQQIINYLEGCKFIFDIYINNTLENYNWVYNYEVAPNLIDIYNFLKNKTSKELEELFDYTKNYRHQYLTYKTYNKYINYLKFKNIKNILKKFNGNIKINIRHSNIESLMKKYFVYNNIKDIFKNNYNKKYINKCITIKMYDIAKIL